jgi:hypothetical protein
MAHKGLQGTITISRPQGRDVSWIEITLHDELSGVEFATVYIDPANFAEALTGLGHVPCKFDLRPSLVGKKAEHKEEIVPFEGGGYVKPGLPRENAAAPYLAPFEIDGWKGRVDDLFNHHRHTPNGYRVTFVRYVDVEKG